MHTAPYHMVPVVMGTFTYFMVLDAKGFPVAQGTLEVCKKALEDRS